MKITNPVSTAILYNKFIKYLPNIDVNIGHSDCAAGMESVDRIYIQVHLNTKNN